MRIAKKIMTTITVLIVILGCYFAPTIVAHHMDEQVLNTETELKNSVDLVPKIGGTMNKLNLVYKLLERKPVLIIDELYSKIDTMIMVELEDLVSCYKNVNETEQFLMGIDSSSLDMIECELEYLYDENYGMLVVDFQLADEIRKCYIHGRMDYDTEKILSISLSVNDEENMESYIEPFVTAYMMYLDIEQFSISEANYVFIYNGDAQYHIPVSYGGNTLYINE